MSNLTRLINTMMIQSAGFPDGTLTVNGQIQTRSSFAEGGMYTINSGATYIPCGTSCTVHAGFANVGFGSVQDRKTPDAVVVPIPPGSSVSMDKKWLQTGYAVYSSATSMPEALVSSGQGLLSGGTYTARYSMEIYSGGTATALSMASGSIYVYEGGVASGNSSTGLLVVDGGTAVAGNASNAVVKNSGAASQVYVGNAMALSSGGIAVSCAVNGYLTVFSGGIASGVEVRQRATVLDGGLSVAPVGSYCVVSSGGVASNVCVGVGTETPRPYVGTLSVEKGGSALSVDWAATAIPETVLFYDPADVQFTSSRSGIMVGSRKGSSISGSAIASGMLDIYSGGTASNITLRNSGRARVLSGGLLSSSVVGSSGTVYVYRGGTAKAIAVQQAGIVGLPDEYGLIVRGGSASGVDVLSGNLLIDSGGSVDTARVSGGIMNVASGGYARRVYELGGYVQAEPGASVVYSSYSPPADIGTVTRSATVHSGTHIGNVAVGSNLSAYVEVLSGGIVDSLTIGRYGSDSIISSGGSVGYMSCYTTIQPIAGKVDTAYGNRSNHIAFASGGTCLYVGNVDTLQVSAGARVSTVENVASATIGGSVTSVAGYAKTVAVLDQGHVGSICVSSRSGEATSSLSVNVTGSADYVELLYPSLSASVDVYGHAGMICVNPYCRCNIRGAADVTVRENGGEVLLYNEFSGTIGYASNTISGYTFARTAEYPAYVGTMTIHSGTTGLDMLIGVDGSNGVPWDRTVEVYSGGSVASTTVGMGGIMTLHSGATATAITERLGYVDVDPGASVEFAPISINVWGINGSSAGRTISMTLHSGTTVYVSSSVTSDVYAHVYSGGCLMHATLTYNARCVLHGGGQASDLTMGVYGGLDIESGGTAVNIAHLSGTHGTVVSSGGYLIGASMPATTATVLHVSSGGTALNVALASAGPGTVYNNVVAENGAVVTYIYPFDPPVLSDTWWFSAERQGVPVTCEFHAMVSPLAPGISYSADVAIGDIQATWYLYAYYEASEGVVVYSISTDPDITTPTATLFYHAYGDQEAGVLYDGMTFTPGTQYAQDWGIGTLTLAQP